MAAGELREKVAFDQRGTTEEDLGTPIDDWANVIAGVAARIRYLKGGEQVIGQRLTGVQPVVITVRSSEATRAITTDYRARDVRKGQAYNIRSVTPDETGAYIDLLCTIGDADG